MMRTSVRSETGCPSWSSRCMNPAIGATLRHAESSSLPSTVGRSFTRAAVAVLAPAPPLAASDCIWAPTGLAAAMKSSVAQSNGDDVRDGFAKFVFTRMTRMNTEEAERSTGKTKLHHKELTGEILGGYRRRLRVIPVKRTF